MSVISLQTIEAITIIMDKIENKDPNFRQNQKWKDLYNYKTQYYRKYVESELKYAKAKYESTGEKKFADKIKQCEDYLKQEDIHV